MKKRSVLYLSKRERQILDVVYRLGEATAGEIVLRLPEAGDASVRKLVRVLEEKGLLATVGRRGHAHVYRPTVSHKDASRSALRHVIDVFFGGSAPKAVAALLDPTGRKLTESERKALDALIEKAAGEGR